MTTSARVRACAYHFIAGEHYGCEEGLCGLCQSLSQQPRENSAAAEAVPCMQRWDALFWAARARAFAAEAGEP